MTNKKKNLPTKEYNLVETLNKIETELKSLVADEQEYFTNGEFYFRLSDAPRAVPDCDIKKCNDLGLLITVHSFVMSRNAQYKKSAELLGLQAYPVWEWLGYSVDKWVHDLSLRVKLLTSTNRINQLKKAQNRLKSLLTRDEQLEDVFNMLGYEDNPFE